MSGGARMVERVPPGTLPLRRRPPRSRGRHRAHRTGADDRGGPGFRGLRTGLRRGGCHDRGPLGDGVRRWARSSPSAPPARCSRALRCGSRSTPGRPSGSPRPRTPRSSLRCWRSCSPTPPNAGASPSGRAVRPEIRPRAGRGHGFGRSRRSSRRDHRSAVPPSSNRHSRKLPTVRSAPHRPGDPVPRDPGGQIASFERIEDPAEPPLELEVRVRNRRAVPSSAPVGGRGRARP